MRMQVHSFLFSLHSLTLFLIFANPNLSFYFRYIQQLQAVVHWFMFCNYRWIWQQNAFSSCFKFLVNVGKRIEFVCSRRKINSFINVNGNALSNQMAKYLSHWNVNCVVSQLVRYTFVGIVECDAKIIKSSRIMNNERMCIRCYSERIRARPTGIAQIGMRRAWAKRETYFLFFFALTINEHLTATKCSAFALSMRVCCHQTRTIAKYTYINQNHNTHH